MNVGQERILALRATNALLKAVTERIDQAVAGESLSRQEYSEVVKYATEKLADAGDIRGAIMSTHTLSRAAHR
jgi:hypothetical protein